MDKFDIGIFSLISFFTLIVFLFSSRKENNTTKLIFGFMLFTVFVYSGAGISYESVSNKYIISYALFCIGLSVSAKVMLHNKLIFGRKNNSYGNFSSRRFDFNYDNKFVTFLAILFMITNGMHLIVPSFNILKLFSPGLPTSELIYARRAASNTNIILRICSTINIFCLPFFCMYLKKLIDQRKKGIAVILVILWMYLDYLQYDYLSRYQFLVFFAFAYCIIAFIYNDGIVLIKRYVLVALISFLVLIPFLNAYIDIRNGHSFQIESIVKAVKTLAESEIYYPKNYDICESLYGSESILNFMLWIICLPIPSVLFPGKPTVTIAYEFTYAVTGLQYGAQEYYTSSLPSVVGEGIIVWGPWLVGFHGIVIGVFIGSYFKFINRHKSLSVLNVYMLLMALTIGRGGASSYMSTLINGTFAMLLWAYISNRIQKEKEIYD